LQNIKNQEKEEAKSKQFETEIFSPERIAAEEDFGEKSTIVSKTIYLPISRRIDPKERTDLVASDITYKPVETEEKTVYSLLEYKPKTKETVIENQDTLPVYSEILGDSESITFSKILEMIIKYYATSGVNIAIKFNDFYEFQKAYALLLGVLSKTGYNSYRMGIAIRKAIVSWSNLPSLVHVKTVAHVIAKYKEETAKKDEIVKQLGQGLVEEKTINISNQAKCVAEFSNDKAQCIAEFSNEKAQCHSMTGGSTDFYHKYMKYKTKYHHLKKNN
jgi:hypothetical protein